MSAFPGYVKPADNWLDTGVIYARDDESVFFGWGATRGGINFDPAKEVRNIPFDGKTSDIEGLDRVLRYAPVLTFNVIDLSLAMLGRLEPGSTTDSSGSSSRVVPINATVIFSANAYTKDVLWISRTRDDGRIAVVAIPRGLVKASKYTAAPDNETEVAVEIMAVIPADATDINVAPYRYFYCNSVDDLDALLPEFFGIPGYVG